MKNVYYILFVFSCLSVQCIEGQNVSNLSKQTLRITQDTMILDSMSIVPSSEIVSLNNQLISQNQYEIIYAKGIFILKDKNLKNKELTFIYRVFPYNYSEPYQHKKIEKIVPYGKKEKNPFSYEYAAESEDIFYLNGLNKSGSISRGVAFGNNQDLSVNSSLNLQLSGGISENISILASISDDNIPIQPEGNTQQLQEFDRVFIQFFSDSWKLTAGDFYMERPKSYFMNFNKKVKGGSFEVAFKPLKNNNKAIMKPILSGALSKGKFARNKIKGVEGNQGPYRLKGAENETFIIVLSGTEQIYIDGKLMKRGNEFDYIIDYNTAEITFTANTLITSNSRIVAEFQYSDRNYARSLVHFGNDYKSEKLQLGFNIYSEQDSRNQPLQQELTDDDKLIMASVGDSLQNAVVPNINLVDFSENFVLYKMIDTLGFDSIFVYSTNPDSARYQLGFSYLGPNKGNYLQIQSTANGKVYQWVMPIGGVPQGEYEPVILLVTPKTKQMVTFGGKFNYTKESFVGWEGAVSNNDINTFSDKDSEDDIGYAFKLNTYNKINLDSNEQPLKFKIGGRYEFVDKYFNPIERYRTVEFERDWNISNVQFSSNQFIANAFLGLEKKKKANLQYDVDVMKNQSELDGLKNSVTTFYTFKGFALQGNGSFLTTEGINNTDFLRHKGTFTKQIKWLVLGLGEESEQNKFYLSKNTDSLQAGSYEYIMWEAFVKSADSTQNNFLINYQHRTDKAPLINQFKEATSAEDVTFALGLITHPNHKFRLKFSYRKLTILDPAFSTIDPEENVLARVEYVAKFLKRVITSNTYYEVGSGLEVKKEFSFVEVQPGQGTHAYIGDINNNGVKDLNEFEIAIYQDQANFIKIFTPTNQFVRIFTNQFNQGLFLKPESVWGKEKGIKKIISKFSNRTNYRINRKVTNKDDYFNPFIGNITDSTLVTLNYGFLNTVYFNRTGTKFGADFTFQDNKSRSLLTNGIESRQTLNRALKVRWNITRVYSVNLIGTNGIKTNQSEFFNNRNFYLTIYNAEPKFTFQPNVKFRASVYYNYEQKNNAERFGKEQLVSQTLGTELRYNIATKGSFRAIFNYIDNQFSETNNATITYEMMEGLQEGTNMTWELNYQQNLSKFMQLSVNYNGRVSDNSPVIHTGAVQVRAFF